MVGRPLSAPLPEAPGPTKRINECFPSLEAAEQWRAAALAAREAGLPLPEAEPYRALSSGRAVDHLLNIAGNTNEGRNN